MKATASSRVAAPGAATFCAAACCAAAFCAVVFGSPHAAADDLPLETLALNDTASVQDALELQTTSSVSYLRSDERRSDALRAALELEMGVWDGVQLMAAVPFEHYATPGAAVNGLGSIELGASVALLATEPLLLAAGAELELPASDAVLGEEAISGGPFVLGDLQLGRVHLGGAAGLSLEGADELELVPELGAAAYVALGPLIPALELSTTLAEQTEVVLAPGVFAELGGDWELGVAGILGLSANAPSGALLVLTFEAELAGGAEQDE